MKETGRWIPGGPPFVENAGAAAGPNEKRPAFEGCDLTVNRSATELGQLTGDSVGAPPVAEQVENARGDGIGGYAQAGRKVMNDEAALIPIQNEPRCTPKRPAFAPHQPRSFSPSSLRRPLGMKHTRRSSSNFALRLLTSRILRSSSEAE